MMWRSAYCATSSGIDIEICRASTQPAFPSCVRTRYQSSVGTGGAGGGPSPFTSAMRGRDRSTQFPGGAGAGGGGGGGTLLSDLSEATLSDDLSRFDAFLPALLFLAGAAAADGGGITAFRGDTRCSSTSTAPPSGICVKLGACLLGAVCTFSESKVVPFPCEGSLAANSDRRSRSATCCWLSR